jgi:hypothetical protein
MVDESDPDGTTVLQSHGHISFDATCPDAFRQLVRDTLNESEFIRMTESEAESNDLLVINEVYQDE